MGVPTEHDLKRIPVTFSFPKLRHFSLPSRISPQKSIHFGQYTALHGRMINNKVTNKGMRYMWVTKRILA